MSVQRPPALLEGNARAAQKSLPGNAKFDCVGENYEPGGKKSAMRLGLSGTSVWLYQTEMMRYRQCSRPKSFLNWKRRTATDFAKQQYRRGFARRNLAREPDHLGHRRRLADDLIEAESPLLLPPQEPDLAPESAGLDPVADGDLEFTEPDRLADEIVSAAAQRRDRVFELDVARDHDHDGLRLAPLVFEQGVESGSVGQIDVLKHSRGPLGVEGLQRPSHSRGFERFISPTAQRFGQCEANRRIVINHEYFLFWHSPAFLKKYTPLRH